MGAYLYWCVVYRLFRDFAETNLIQLQEKWMEHKSRNATWAKSLILPLQAPKKWWFVQHIGLKPELKTWKTLSKRGQIALLHQYFLVVPERFPCFLWGKIEDFKVKIGTLSFTKGEAIHWTPLKPWKQPLKIDTIFPVLKNWKNKTGTLTLCKFPKIFFLSFYFILLPLVMSLLVSPTQSVTPVVALCCPMQLILIL